MFGKFTRRRSSRRRSRHIIACEPLEQRILLDGQSFVVTIVADELDPNTGITLREAVLRANAIPGPDRIVVHDTRNQSITLDLPEAEGGGGTIHITDSVEIVGGANFDGTDIVIDGLGQMRPFQVAGDGVVVTFTDLTIRKGLAPDGGNARPEDLDRLAGPSACSRVHRW